MAGLAKPNVEGLGTEAEYMINGSVVENGSANGLFDGTQPDHWYTETIFYWNSTDCYIDITIKNSCNIWRSGTYSWSNHKAPFIIRKYDEETHQWVDITSSVEQNVTAITNTQWEKTICNLKKGRYRFSTNGLRIDSEWYLERIPEYNCLIKENNIYKTIHQSQLKEVDVAELYDEDSSVCIKDMNNIISILPQLSDEFELVFNKEVEIEASGLKSRSELIIPTSTFSTKLASNIDHFELIYTGSIKCAISDDEGVTWKTWRNSKWEVLNNSVPIKEYSSLSSDELIQWNELKNEIAKNGFIPRPNNDIDYNLLESHNIMFAYVIERTIYDDVTEMKQLKYQFDANGTFVLCDNNKVEIGQSTDIVKITPKQNMDLLKVNIGSSGIVNVINPDFNINNLTDDELRKLKEKLEQL